MSGAARQLLREADDSVEAAVGIYFSSQQGGAASGARGNTPSEQLQAILGPDVSSEQVEALLRDAHNDVQAAANLHYQHEGKPWPLNHRSFQQTVPDMQGCPSSKTCSGKSIGAAAHLGVTSTVITGSPEAELEAARGDAPVPGAEEPEEDAGEEAAAPAEPSRRRARGGGGSSRGAATSKLMLKAHPDEALVVARMS